jgi:hypothetical protein
MERLMNWTRSGAATRTLRLVEQLMEQLSLPREDVAEGHWALQGPVLYGFPLELGLMLTGEHLMVCGRAALILDRDFAAREIAFVMLERNDFVPYGSYRLVRVGDRYEAMLGHLVDVSRENSPESLVRISSSILEEMRAMVVRLYATDLLYTEFAPPRG